MCQTAPWGTLRLDLNEVRDGLTYFLSRDWDVKGRDQWHQITN